MTALFLALLHAIPVSAVAALSGSKMATILTFMVMIAVAFGLGSPVFAAFDAAAVCWSLWYALRQLDRQATKGRSDEAQG